MGVGGATAAPWGMVKILGHLFLRPKPGRGFLLSSFRGLLLHPLELEIFQIFFFQTFSTSWEKLGSKGTQLNLVAHKGLKYLIFNSPGTWVPLLKSFFRGFSTKLFFPQKNSCRLVSDAEVQSPCVLLWDEGDVHGKSVPKNVTKRHPNLQFSSSSEVQTNQRVHTRRGLLYLYLYLNFRV